MLGLRPAPPSSAPALAALVTPARPGGSRGRSVEATARPAAEKSRRSARPIRRLIGRGRPVTACAGHGLAGGRLGGSTRRARPPALAPLDITRALCRLPAGRPCGGRKRPASRSACPPPPPGGSLNRTRPTAVTVHFSERRLRRSPGPPLRGVPSSCRRSRHREGRLPGTAQRPGREADRVRWSDGRRRSCSRPRRSEHGTPFDGGPRAAPRT